MLRAVGADIVIAADRLAVWPVLIQRRAAGCHIGIAMPLRVAATADNLGLDPAGGGRGERRSADWLRGHDRSGDADYQQCQNRHASQKE